MALGVPPGGSAVALVGALEVMLYEALGGALEVMLYEALGVAQCSSCVFVWP